MQLSKDRLDLGLCTNQLRPMLEFWQTKVGLPFDHVLPVRRGQKQYRHDAFGSVIKINHFEEPLPVEPPSGYRELIVARPDITCVQSLEDPDGNRISLVPPGHEGVGQTAVRIGVRDLNAHRRFYADALGLPEEQRLQGAAFRAGESLIILEERADASVDAGHHGAGFRYITFQVFKVDEVHARILNAGAREGLPPTTLGNVARISMVLDPDGNWIELSQRASIVGSLT
jgi:catechol 2,3-dioxygenase-like lactoylglutathione lyase family enzyme